MLMLTAFSHSNRPGLPALSVNVTAFKAMLPHGVEAKHLNWATVVFLKGRRLLWLLLPLIRSKEMSVKNVVGEEGVAGE